MDAKPTPILMMHSYQEVYKAMYSTSQSVFSYPRQIMLTLDTTEISNLFIPSILLCLHLVNIQNEFKVWIRFLTSTLILSWGHWNEIIWVQRCWRVLQHPCWQEVVLMVKRPVLNYYWCRIVRPLKSQNFLHQQNKNVKCVLFIK